MQQPSIWYLRNHIDTGRIRKESRYEFPAKDTLLIVLEGTYSNLDMQKGVNRIKRDHKVLRKQ